MKVFVLVLLAVLLFVEQAHTLVCFTCTKKKGTLGCLKISFCSVDDQYCVSQTVSSVLGHQAKTISKYCSPICPTSGITTGVTVVTSRCCKVHLCNIFSNSGGLQVNFLVLGLSVLFSLLYTLVRPGA
ncbi:lymphocyte antigen 6E-like [Notamacropus eugenii]|uniref:lymphocyte antigen 6E-like n=1 Tax=Notamacropus eugenii TaxID=9315 RepID=UPI003B682D73